MRKPFLVLVFSVVLALSGGIGLVNGNDDSPRPVAQGSPSVSAGGNGDLAGVITTLQDSVRRVPTDHRSWAMLALAYVEQARVTGDASSYGRAEESAARSLQIQPEQNFTALTAQAALAAARHDFSAALTKARGALEVNPYDEYALAVRVDALTELGRYGEQLRALDIADRRRPGVPIAARYAYAFELRGDLDRAARILRTAAAPAGPADRAYLLTLLADVERRQGLLARAAAHLNAVRQAQPDYLPAEVSRARLDLARGRLDEATRRWSGVVARLPLPEYLTEFGELLLHQGRRARAAEQFAVVESTIRILDAQGVQTDLETALYEADHGSLEAAVDAARAEYRRRSSIHTADVLAWALHRSGRSAEALPLAREATRLGTPEARLWVHRGMIESALGLRDAAVQHLRRGLQMDPGYSPWHAHQAQRLLRELEDAS